MSHVNIRPILVKRNKAKSKRLIALDKQYIWHPFTQMKDWLQEESLVIEEAKGNYLKDTAGRWYLDGISSLWVNVHGHRKKEIDRAVNEQLKKVSHSTLLGLGNVPSIELAAALVKIAPRDLRKVFYSDDGSTAVEIALKLAYQYWQNIGKTKKKRFVYLQNSYHGDTVGSVSVGGIDLFHAMYKPLLFNSMKVEAPYCYRCPQRKTYPGCKLECLKQLRNTLKKHNNSIAALIIEPMVQGAAGMIVWPQGILKRMRQLCTKHDMLLIADEVATGFGRTGKMFACKHESVTPDIMCLAKGISGGYLPIAATLTTQKIFNAFVVDYKDKKTFFHGHTYTGNPLAAAASLANIKIFHKEKTLKKLGPKIVFLKKELKRFLALKHVGDIRQKGFMVGIELVKNKSTKEPYIWEERIGVKVCQELRNHSIILRPLGNVIVLMPPLSITRSELKTLLYRTYIAIQKITEKHEKK
ncbi:adenosylmethionine--8-amino-7-oxononanoate transaminase [Candidatus Omnitrophota bacterium]